MESKFAVSSGVWKIEQDTSTLEVRLYKYGQEVAMWQEERIMSWDDLYNLMLVESYERRGGK